ncbi:MAG: hypothetical protein AVDCRST_MAG56-969, partial [uncultured Cytophagales bacterium]
CTGLPLGSLPSASYSSLRPCWPAKASSWYRSPVRAWCWATAARPCGGGGRHAARGSTAGSRKSCWSKSKGTCWPRKPSWTGPNARGSASKS